MSKINKNTNIAQLKAMTSNISRDITSNSLFNYREREISVEKFRLEFKAGDKKFIWMINGFFHDIPCA